MQRCVLRQKRRFNDRHKPLVGGRNQSSPSQRSNDGVQTEQHQRNDNQRQNVLANESHRKNPYDSTVGLSSLIFTANLSSTTTTSPRAIKMLLTYRSIGSVDNLSSSNTLPD